MRLQKVKIAIHPVIAIIRPDLLVKLMALDRYCYPIKTYVPYKSNSTEYGPMCTLYFRKKFDKKQLRKLRGFRYPRGLFIEICNTYDNPCLVQEGHSPEYAVCLHEVDEVGNVLKEMIKEIRALKIKE